MGNVVEVPDKNMKKGFRLVTLFEEAEAEQDEFGLWQVKLECTQKAMKYFFNVENLGYLRYKLRCITSLTSRYTYIMFIYLEANRFRKSWEVDLDDLKAILHCENEETYKEFKRFNDLLLKRVHKEMHEKTECRYEYEPIKKGRSVVSIRFTLETNLNFESAEQLEIEDLEDLQDQDTELQEEREMICSGFSNKAFNDFSDEELEILRELAWPKKDEKQVEQHYKALHDKHLACEYAVTDYLRLKIKNAKLKKPKNLFLYLKKMIEND